MSLSLQALNDCLQFPCVRFTGFKASPSSLHLRGQVVAYGGTGKVLDYEHVDLDYRELTNLEMEGAVRLCQDRIAEAKARLAEKMKAVPV